MKKLLLLSTLFIFSFSFFAQTIDVGSIDPGTIDLKGKKVRSTMESEGSFVIANTDQVNSLKLRIDALGEVNWFLDKQLMYIRDGAFEAFPVEEPNALYKYDFLHIDGGNGRIGFNVLDGYSDDTEGGETDLPLTSSVTLMGSIATKIRFVDGSATNGYTIKQDDHILIVRLSNNDDENLVLPEAANCRGRSYLIKRDEETGNKADLIIEAASGESIDGSDSYSISKTLGVVEVVCDGTQWWIISEEDQLASNEIEDSEILDDDDIIGVKFNSDGQSITLTLPPAANKDEKRYEIKRNSDGVTWPGGNTLLIVPTGDEKLDQFNNTDNIYTMSNDWEGVTVVSTGTRWLILGNYGHTP